MCPEPGLLGQRDGLLAFAGLAGLALDGRTLVALLRHVAGRLLLAPQPGAIVPRWPRAWRPHAACTHTCIYDLMARRAVCVACCSCSWTMVEAVAGVLAMLATVGGMLAEIEAVAGVPTQLEAVAGVPTQLEAVAGVLAQLKAVAGMLAVHALLRAMEVRVARAAPAKPPRVDRSDMLRACTDLLEALLWYSGVTLASADFDQLWTVPAALPAPNADTQLFYAWLLDSARSPLAARRRVGLAPRAALRRRHQAAGRPPPRGLCAPRCRTSAPPPTSA